MSLLTARKLPPRFNTVPFLTIHDPEADVRDRVSPRLHTSVPNAEARSRPSLIFRLSRNLFHPQHGLINSKSFLSVSFISLRIIPIFQPHTKTCKRWPSRLLLPCLGVPLMLHPRYIDFYLDLIASPDNIALLYHLAMKAKTVRDAESHTYSEVRVLVRGLQTMANVLRSRICIRWPSLPKS